MEVALRWVSSRTLLKKRPRALRYVRHADDLRERGALYERTHQRHRHGVTSERNKYFSPLCTACIWTDDNTILDVKVLADPPQRARFGVKVVNGHIEESLNLTCVKIHRDHVVATCCLQHVCHELSSDGCSGLVLFVLTGIRKVWNHSSNAASGCRLARVDHDE